MMIKGHSKHKSSLMKVRGKGKAFVLMLSMVLILMFSVGGTAAYLVASSNVTDNNFAYAKVTCTVDETFNGTVKSNVSIRNTGGTDSYIRCALVVGWENEQGDVLGRRPVLGTDYNMTLDLANGWSRGSDGYYYWEDPVAPEASTGILIQSLSPVEGNVPAGYGLNVKILADSVQSSPSRAVKEAWNVTVNGGKVSK